MRILLAKSATELGERGGGAEIATKADGIQGLVKLKPTLKPENTGANRVRSFMLLLCVVSAEGNQRRVSSKSGQTYKRFVVFLFTGKCRPIDVAALS